MNSNAVVMLEKMSMINSSSDLTTGSKVTSSTPKTNNRKQPIIILERISDIKSNTPKEKSAPTHSYSPLTTPKANVEFSRELKQVIHEKNLLTRRTKKKVFDVLDEIEINHKSEGVQRKRENAVFEIIVSEKNYVNQLSVIINFFMKPVKEKKLLSSEDYEILFGNIQSIHNLNVTLLQELYRGSKNVSNAFLTIVPYLKMYSSYAVGFKKILDLIQRSRIRNPNFYNFMEMQETRPEVQNKLSALLIAPIQRIPRYRLLLQQLYELSSPSDPDYNDILKSLNKVEEVALHINKNLEHQENIQRLLEVQRYLKNNEPAIITPGRELKKEGILYQFDNKSGPSEKFYTILLNDIVLFCKMKSETLKANSLKCKKIFPLNKCEIVENEEKGCFQVFCQNENIILYDRKLTVTKEWIECIRNAADVLTEKRKTLRKGSSARRPVKRKDLNEYNDEGLSPGLPLKRRRQTIQEDLTEDKRILPRRSIRSVTPSCSRSNHFLQRHKSESRISENKFEIPSNNCQIPSNNEQPRKDVFVFGSDNPNNSFTFKFTNMLSNISSSVFNMFRFRR